MKKNGLTTVEVLMSAFILMIVTIGVVLFSAQLLDMAKRMDYQYASVNLAKNRLERTKNIIHSNGFDSLPDMAENQTIVNENGAPDLNGDFERTTIVTTNYNGDPLLTRVVVNVRYKYRGSTNSVPVTSSTIFIDGF